MPNTIHNIIVYTYYQIIIDKIKNINCYINYYKLYLDIVMEIGFGRENNRFDFEF